MNALSSFPIAERWKPTDPNVIQLYSFPTPNGVKISITLEETGMPYEAHLVDIRSDDQKGSEFLSRNPNGKIPALIDPDGPGGEPIGIFESGAIMLYLAEKTGKLIPADPTGRGGVHPVAVLSDGGRRADIRTIRPFLQIHGR